MVVAAHDPLVRPVRALAPGDDVADRRRPPIEGERQAHARRPRPQAVDDRQRAAPFRRGDGSLQRVEQRSGVGVGQRQGGDVRQPRRVVEVEPARAPDRRPTGRPRVPGEPRHVQDRAALHAAVVLERPFRVDLALRVAVVRRVGVDQAADGAALGRELGLDASEGPAVADDDDLARDVDAVAFEPLVVLPEPVVRVDEFGLDVAVRRKGVVGRQEFAVPSAAVVPLRVALDQGRPERPRREHFQAARPRDRQQHFVALDGGVVAPALEEPLQVLRVAPAAGRSGVVRPGRQVAQPAAHFARVEPGVELGLQRALRGRPRRVETRQRFVAGRGRGGGQRQRQRQGPDTSSHRSSSLRRPLRPARGSGGVFRRGSRAPESAQAGRSPMIVTRSIERRCGQ